MNAPKVSVILPTHNRAQVLDRAIRSVLAQTMGDLELIVVDDGSTDATPEVVASFDDPRIHYLKSEQRGAAAARNLGVRASRAPLLAFQDSDDEWILGKLRAQCEAYAKLDKDNPGLLCGGFLVLMKSGAVPYVRPDARMRRGDWGPDNLQDFRFITPTWLIARATFEQLGGFDEDMPNSEDWEFVFRLYRHVGGSGIIVLDQPLVIKHVCDDSLHMDLDIRLRSVRKIIDKHGAIWAEAPRDMARLYAEMGQSNCELGCMAEGQRWLAQALRLDPMRRGHWKRWLASHLGSAVYLRLCDRRK